MQTTYSQNRAKDPRSQFYTPEQPTSNVNNMINRPSLPQAPSNLQDYILAQRQQDNARMNQIPQQMAFGGQDPSYRNLTGQQSVDTSDIPGAPDAPNLERIRMLASQALADNQSLTNSQPVVPAEDDTSPQPDFKYYSPPQPLSSEDKTFTQDSVNQAKQAMQMGLQAKTGGEGMTAANNASGNKRVMGDLQKVAESKDPMKAWQNMKEEPFYKDSSFYNGIMGLGLAIMSGKSPIEAFQISQGMYENDEIKKQLATNRDFLIEQGYSNDSVASAIAKGNPQLLKMKEMSQKDQAALALQNQLATEQRGDLRWEQRNAIQQAADDRRMDRQEALADRRMALSDQRMALRGEQSLERQKALLDYRNAAKAKADELKAQSFDFGSRDLNSEKNTPDGSVVKSWSVKQGYFDAAKKDLDLAREAIQKGNRQAATAAFKQAVFNSARGEIGENRSLQGSDLAEFAEDPSVVVRTINDIKLKAGFNPTLDAIGYVDSANQVGSDSAYSNIKRIKEKRIIANAKTMGAKKATALVNRAFGSGWHDPLNAFPEDETPTTLTGGALSSGSLGDSEDPSWMTE